MSLYLYQNNQQTGPFTEEQIRQMLQSGTITPGTMGWKDGMPAWTPVSSILPPMPGPVGAPPPPPPPSKGSGAWLGITSVIIGLFTILVWVVLFIFVAVAQKDGTVTETFNIIVGFVFMGGVGVNFMAMVLGIIGIFKSKSNTMSIIGACLNAFMILGLIVLILIGLATKSAN